MECRLMVALPIIQLLLMNHINSYTLAASSSSSSSSSSIANTKYIKASCSVTRYPKLCFTSLSVYAGKIKSSPRAVAQTALNTTIEASKATSKVINKCARVEGMKPIEIAAALDCVEEVSDALDKLHKSMKKLSHAVKGSRRFSVEMRDVQAWVRAALADEDTCMDGFDEPKLKGRVPTIVRRQITKMAHLTSNALALINTYASD